MKIAVIDNYDSFTYNLVHILEDLTGELPQVFRNDQLVLEDLELYDFILLSPGPGIPDEAGLLKDIIKHYAGKKPIFGVCLGLQAIVEVFGGEILNLDSVFHGIATPMKVLDKDEIIFQDVEDSFEAARYHSWVADREKLPDDLLITSEDDQGQIMAIRHKTLPIHAVQYHPESILTETGPKQIENLLKYYKVL